MGESRMSGFLRTGIAYAVRLSRAKHLRRYLQNEIEFLGWIPVIL